MLRSNFKIYSYNQNSASAAALAQALEVKRLKHEGSTFVGKPKHIVLNWGSSDIKVNIGEAKVLNKPSDIGVWSNKLTAFTEMKNIGIAHPAWGTTKEWAREQIENDKVVFARTILSGHSGSGIVEMTKSNPDQWVPSKLYTVYIPKESEYRVHFFNKKCIDIQKKLFKRELIGPDDEPNWKIRNLANGFVYARNDIKIPDDVVTVANSTIEKIPLDFGAIDIIYNAKSNKAYVLEINTAPGLKGATLEAYSKAISETYFGAAG